VGSDWGLEVEEGSGSAEEAGSAWVAEAGWVSEAAEDSGLEAAAD